MSSSRDYAARAAQRRRRMTIFVAGGILLAMIIAVSLAATSGLGNSKKSSGTKTANGLVQIANKADYVVVDSGAGASSAGSATKQCRGTGNFTDISRGGTVTISDFNGTSLASTNLGQGVVDPNGYCVFGFTASVPVNRGPYSVQITRRKAVQVNEGDLFTLVTLTLGATTG